MATKISEQFETSMFIKMFRVKIVYVIYHSTGKEANVPKGTKVVIPITTQKSRLDQSNFAKWDAVVYRQTGKALILQVNTFIK